MYTLVSLQCRKARLSYTDSLCFFRILFGKSLKFFLTHRIRKHRIHCLKQLFQCIKFRTMQFKRHDSPPDNFLALMRKRVPAYIAEKTHPYHPSIVQVLCEKNKREEKFFQYHVSILSASTFGRLGGSLISFARTSISPARIFLPVKSCHTRIQRAKGYRSHPALGTKSNIPKNDNGISTQITKGDFSFRSS